MRRSLQMVSGGSGKQPSTLATEKWSRTGVQAYWRLRSWVMPRRFEGAGEWSRMGHGSIPHLTSKESSQAHVVVENQPCHAMWS